jgi:hypothetical protein
MSTWEDVYQNAVNPSLYEDNETRRLIDPDLTSGLAQLRQTMIDSYEPNKVLDQEHFRAVCLKQLADVIPSTREGSGESKRIRRIKARIPEIHSFLPIPTSDRDYTTMAMYPTFVGELGTLKDGIITPGSEVIVSFGNMTNFSDPRLIGVREIRKSMKNKRTSSKDAHDAGERDKGAGDRTKPPEKTKKTDILGKDWFYISGLKHSPRGKGTAAKSIVIHESGVSSMTSTYGTLQFRNLGVHWAVSSQGTVQRWVENPAAHQTWHGGLSGGPAINKNSFGIEFCWAFSASAHRQYASGLGGAVKVIAAPWKKTKINNVLKLIKKSFTNSGDIKRRKIMSLADRLQRAGYVTSAGTGGKTDWKAINELLSLDKLLGPVSTGSFLGTGGMLGGALGIPSSSGYRQAVAAVVAAKDALKDAEAELFLEQPSAEGIPSPGFGAAQDALGAAREKLHEAQKKLRATTSGARSKRLENAKKIAIQLAGYPVPPKNGLEALWALVIHIKNTYGVPGGVRAANGNKFTIAPAGGTAASFGPGIIAHGEYAGRSDGQFQTLYMALRAYGNGSTEAYAKAIELANNPKVIWAGASTVVTLTAGAGHHPAGPSGAAFSTYRNRAHKISRVGKAGVVSGVCAGMGEKYATNKKGKKREGGFIDCSKNNVREIDHNVPMVQQYRNSLAKNSHTGAKLGGPSPTIILLEGAELAAATAHEKVPETPTEVVTTTTSSPTVTTAPSTPSKTAGTFGSPGIYKVVNTAGDKKPGLPLQNAVNGAKVGRLKDGDRVTFTGQRKGNWWRVTAKGGSCAWDQTTKDKFKSSNPEYSNICGHSAGWVYTVGDAKTTAILELVTATGPAAPASAPASSTIPAGPGSPVAYKVINTSQDKPSPGLPLMSKARYKGGGTKKLAQIPDSVTDPTAFVTWGGKGSPTDLAVNPMGTWKKVTYKSQMGWVNVRTDKGQASLAEVDAATAAAAPQPSTNTATSSEPPKKFKVIHTGKDTTPGLPLMTNASYPTSKQGWKNQKIATIQDGEIVEWIDRSENRIIVGVVPWFYVSYKGKSGWVRTKTDSNSKTCKSCDSLEGVVE